MKAPRVTIIMPVYNTAPYVLEAVRSIQDQSFQDWELIAVDDVSTDGSLDILKSIDDQRVKVLSTEQNGGAGLAINVGLTSARGEYVAIMDSDDIVHTDRLALEVRYLDENPDVVIVGSEDMVVFFGNDPVDAMVREERQIKGHGLDVDTYLRTRLIFNYPYKHPTVMMRLSMLGTARYGNARYAEDYEMCIKVSKLGAMGLISIPLGFYRMHPGQTTQLAKNKIRIMQEQIWRPCLLATGVPDNVLDLESHALLALTYRSLTAADIPAIQSWIKALIENQRLVPGIDLQVLKNLIVGKTYELCRSSALLGVVSYYLFSRVARSCGVSISFRKKARLFFKCLVAKHAA